MDNQKVNSLWDPDVDYPALRRPCIDPNTANEIVTNNVSNSSNADLVKRSTLSADAKEFYPASFNSAQNTSSPVPVKSVQDRLHKYKHFENDRNEAIYNREPDYLYESIGLLTVKPGKFDSIVPHLLQTLVPFFEDVESISKITAIIFDQALNEPNFTYSGARLCAALDEQCPLLRACLHQLCEKELENTPNLSALTLFFAEIYTQMNFELFGKCLLKALRKMLSSPSPDNVKYICQTLKLSGAKLDELDKKLIDKIFDQLKSLCPTLPSSISNLVQSVISLRNKQWGLIETPSTLPPPAEPVEWSDGPVYYGPDGQQLTLEESEFLSENLNDFILDDTDSDDLWNPGPEMNEALNQFDDTDPDELWNPEPEMNDEIQAAFAEFVRLSNR